MSSPAEPTTLVLTPRAAKRRGRWLSRILLLAVVLVIAAGAGAWAMGVRPKAFWKTRNVEYRTVAVDKGSIRIVVIESGSMESADNAMIKCQVEAILGTVPGGVNGMGGPGAQGGRNGVGGQGGNMAGGARAATAAPAAAPAATAKAGAAGAAAGKAGAAGAAGKAATPVVAAGGGMGGGGVTKPIIQSFTMVVAPHTPLRPQTTAANTAAAKKNQNNMMMMGGQGGGGNRGGGNNGMDMMGQQGSTKIIKLVPEGTIVQAGETVCELDSAAFRDELASQQIRWEQAKSWVEQAKEVLKVSKISLEEYRDGIYKQDLQQIEKYIEICQTKLKQSRDDLAWTKGMAAKQMQSASQLKAAEYGEEQSRIALEEALGMKRRLINFSSPKLINNLQAKIASVEADLLAQEHSFQLEDDRRRKLQRMIDLCILKAPRDGLVAYASASSGPGWNPNSTPMQEGVTVRQGQTIILLPDSNRMRVKVRVNESKVSQVFPGQRTAILVEAFPNKPLTGKVSEVTAIPAPANGPVSDVKLYYANVEIDQGGFEGLRTGLSAQVAFFVDRRDDVTRVPIDAIRWAEREPFVAVPREGQSGFDWRPIELGLIGAKEAEVIKGLKPGDRVVAQPEALTPAPIAFGKRDGGEIAVAKAAPEAGS